MAGGWDEDRQSAEAATQIGQRERGGIFLDAEGPKIIGEKMNRTPPPRRETGEKNCNRRENEFPPGLISGTEKETEREVCSASEVKGLQSPLSCVLPEMKRERK